jgi:deazaflavin-dependent oxidoreductase (nitroreductase family)
MTGINPKLPQWMQDHLRRYLETDGRDGHIWNGVRTLLLTTHGRRSGEPITLPLIYGEDDGRYVLVASKGGAPDHPFWYRNLVAEPVVGVQVAAARFKARARTADGAERDRLWGIMRNIWPQYDDYQKATERRIPVVVLDRIG